MKDVGWHRQETVVVLGEEFGAAGPMILDWLTCNVSSVGVVDAAWSEIATGTFVGREIVERVVEHLALQGDLEVLADDGDRLQCQMRDVRIKSWRRAIGCALRAYVMRRDRFTCQRCGWTPGTPVDYDGTYAPRLGDRHLELDHVFPVARGGPDGEDNLQVLCSPCNRSKGARV